MLVRISTDAKIYTIIHIDHYAVVEAINDTLELNTRNISDNDISSRKKQIFICNGFRKSDNHRVLVVLSGTRPSITESYRFVTPVVRVLAIVKYLLPQEFIVSVIIQVENWQLAHIYIYYFHNHSI